MIFMFIVPNLLFFLYAWHMYQFVTEFWGDDVLTAFCLCFLLTFSDLEVLLTAHRSAVMHLCVCVLELI